MSKRRTSGDTVMNMIIAVVIIAVLALGVWAVYPKISEGIKNRQAANDMSQQMPAQTVTIADVAAEEGISAEDYLAKYGLQNEGFTAETDIQTAIGAMTVENFAKLNGMTAEEFISGSQLPANVTADMKLNDVSLMQAQAAQAADEAQASPEAEKAEETAQPKAEKAESGE